MIVKINWCNNESKNIVDRLTSSLSIGCVTKIDKINNIIEINAINEDDKSTLSNFVGHITFNENGKCYSSLIVDSRSDDELHLTLVEGDALIDYSVVERANGVIS